MDGRRVCYVRCHYSKTGMFYPNCGSFLSFNFRNSGWNTHSQLVQAVNQLQSHLKTCNIAPSVRKRSFPKRLVNHPVSAYILYYVCNKFLGPIPRTNRKRYTPPKKIRIYILFFS